MVDLGSQYVRDLLSDLETRFPTVTWLIWTLSLCVIALKSIVMVSNLVPAHFDFQWVRSSSLLLLAWLNTACINLPLRHWIPTLLSLISFSTACVIMPNLPPYIYNLIDYLTGFSCVWLTSKL